MLLYAQSVDKSVRNSFCKIKNRKYYYTNPLASDYRENVRVGSIVWVRTIQKAAYQFGINR